jgi:hypothetical protein
MKKTFVKILLAFFAVVLVLALIAWHFFLSGINIRARNVERIERLWHGTMPNFESVYSERMGRYVSVQAFTDETQIRDLVNFFNSLTLLRTPPREPTAAAPPEIFRIIYTNGAESYIVFAWTQVHYNDICYWLIDCEQGERSSTRLHNLLRRLAESCVFRNNSGGSRDETT